MTALVNSAKTGFGIGLALALVIVGAILVWGDVSAHDYSPPKKWDTSITPNTTSVDTWYAWEIRSAARDFTSNTDLAVEYCASSCSGSNIRHYENDHGMTGWHARVLFHGNTIRYATVQWNAHSGRIDSFTAHRLARHEMGHAFGLDHVPCGGGPYETSPPSIMGCPSSGVRDLHTHDIQDMNKKY